MTPDASPFSPLNTMQRHELGGYPAFAMLAGMQLDLFTALKDAPLTAAQLADALGVNVTKLQPLLYALVVSALLTVERERFANTAVTSQFLVRGAPAYMDSRHENFADCWSALLQTGTSMRTGVPQAKKDYAVMSEEELTTFYRSLNVTTDHRLEEPSLCQRV